MKERILKLVLYGGMFLLCLVLVRGVFTYAVQDSEEQTSIVTLTIVPTCNLEIVDNNVSETITADSSAESAFDTGYVEFPADRPTLIVDSNKKWKLSVRSTDFTGPYNKDVSDLMLKDSSNLHVKNGFNEFQPLSLEDQDVAMANFGVKDEVHPCQYKIIIDWDKDVPGTYEATVTYTLSTRGS